MACWLTMIIIIIIVNCEISRLVATTKRSLRGLCAYNRVCTNERHASSRSSAQTSTTRALAGCQKASFRKFSKRFMPVERYLLATEIIKLWQCNTIRWYNVILPFFSARISFDATRHIKNSTKNRIILKKLKIKISKILEYENATFSKSKNIKISWKSLKYIKV